MNVLKATKKYEKWVGARTALLPEDSQLKHERMAQSPFMFLRATFYRWAQTWSEAVGSVARAPAVLSIGDLHIENFGTWRDCEGRLVWGVNDFDEAYPLPYTNDLVRLAASAQLAIAEHDLRVTDRDAWDAILEGYTKGINQGGRPFVLSEEHIWLRDIAEEQLRNPLRFWKKMDDLQTVKRVPASATEGLEAMLPERGIDYRVVHRIAGLGSLGRQRYVALARWRGGRIAREAKALIASACFWCGNGQEAEILYQAIITRAVRCPDPFVQLRGNWIVRRLAPDCTKINLSALPKKRDELRLLGAMGYETANVHLGSADRVKAIRTDLQKRKARWLQNAASAMRGAVMNDWKEWRKEFGENKR